jgi:hypothetical protein
VHIADITFIFSIPLLFVSVHPEEPPLRTLGDRGAAEKTIDFWIDKLLNAGDISEPDETIDDQWAKRCGYSDHSAVSEAVRKAKKQLPNE